MQTEDALVLDPAGDAPPLPPPPTIICELAGDAGVTINGVNAHGGSLNATGPTVAGGMVFVNSGYGQLGGMPGNVLLAFSAEGN